MPTVTLKRRQGCVAIEHNVLRLTPPVMRAPIGLEGDYAPILFIMSDTDFREHPIHALG